MSKFLPKKRLHITGSCQLKPHRPTMPSDRELKSEERAAELFVGDKRCQQWIVLIVEAVCIAVRQLAGFPHQSAEQLADKLLMGGALLRRKRRHVAVEEKLCCI